MDLAGWLGGSCSEMEVLYHRVGDCVINHPGPIGRNFSQVAVYALLLGSGLKDGALVITESVRP